MPNCGGILIVSLPFKNASYSFTICLIDAVNTSEFLVSPTVVSGDVKASSDYGVYSNLASIPIVVNGQVHVQLSASEMNADSVTVQFEDQDGPEWLPMRVIIPTI
jgi:hypothetical protein